MYEESGRDDKNIEVNEKGENKKNVKESSYTNVNDGKEKEQAELLKDEKPTFITKYQEKRMKMKKFWSPRKWPYPIWARTFL